MIKNTHLLPKGPFQLRISFTRIQKVQNPLLRSFTPLLPSFKLKPDQHCSAVCAILLQSVGEIGLLILTLLILLINLKNVRNKTILRQK